MIGPWLRPSKKAVGSHTSLMMVSRCQSGIGQGLNSILSRESTWFLDAWCIIFDLVHVLVGNRVKNPELGKICPVSGFLGESSALEGLILLLEVRTPRWVCWKSSLNYWLRRQHAMLEWWFTCSVMAQVSVIDMKFLSSAWSSSQYCWHVGSLNK